MLREDSGEASEGGARGGDPEYGADSAPYRPGNDDYKRRRGDSISGAVVKEVSGTEPQIGERGTTLPGDNSPTVGEFFGRVTGSARGTRGVSAKVGEKQAAIDLTATMPYCRSIPDVTKAMRDNVIQRVENMTSLE